MPTTKKDPASLTAFQSRVYDLISKIPAGQVSTYGGVAAALNSCARAVGGALRGNPFAPIVPCHRVVMSDLSIGGFSGSIGDCPDTRRKTKLLEDEGVRFVKGKVAGDTYVYKFAEGVSPDKIKVASTATAPPAQQGKTSLKTGRRGKRKSCGEGHASGRDTMSDLGPQVGLETKRTKRFALE